MKKLLNEKNKFYYFDLGSGKRTQTFRVWVNRKLIKFNENNNPYIELPLKGAKLLKGNKPRTLIIKPDNNSDLVIDFYTVVCGYRGNSEVSPINFPQNSIYYTFEEYSSPRGNLGVSEGFIFNTDKEKLYFSYERSGRLYGDPGYGIIEWNKEKRFLQYKGITYNDLKELEVE